MITPFGWSLVSEINSRFLLLSIAPVSLPPTPSSSSTCHLTNKSLSVIDSRLSPSTTLSLFQFWLKPTILENPSHHRLLSPLLAFCLEAFRLRDVSVWGVSCQGTFWFEEVSCYGRFGFGAFPVRVVLVWRRFGLDRFVPEARRLFWGRFSLGRFVSRAFCPGEFRFTDFSAAPVLLFLVLVFSLLFCFSALCS